MKLESHLSLDIVMIAGFGGEIISGYSYNYWFWGEISGHSYDYWFEVEHFNKQFL